MMPGDDSENRNLWEAIGELRAKVQWLLEGQQRLERGLAEINGRLGRGLAETNGGIDGKFERLCRKIDRLTYIALGLGGVIIGLLIMDVVRG